MWCVYHGLPGQQVVGGADEGLEVLEDVGQGQEAGPLWAVVVSC